MPSPDVDINYHMLTRSLDNHPWPNHLNKSKSTLTPSNPFGTPIPRLPTSKKPPEFSKTIQAGTPLNINDLFNAEHDVAKLVSFTQKWKRQCQFCRGDKRRKPPHHHARLEYSDGDLIAMLNNIQTSINRLHEDMDAKFKELDRLESWREKAHEG
ncbi:hypothetical protein BDP27DRAFT_1433665 [Rhodocollybia butyracea]|uniref:Uncharacterized protein n=1 Tax=Rhodocollybia butyracea TaxID=206335 RepID=A0A9P5P7K2_9AGAR|nr:hypothetical protein BDP27DRAFT_1433665 [Rhodocollybia butyracea]